jgi:nucleotidyltransferase/DNA polymerase involved in DNA repair
MRFKTSNKTYIHVDCDSFFASCEILRNPRLKNKYVCVWGDIIVACCYKCKAVGIWVWTPVWEAKRILKDKWVFLWTDIAFYTKISEDIIEYLRENTCSMEQFSIDEAFCDITWIPEYLKISTHDFLLKIQKEILDDIWIPISIWCANTRIKAKIFSPVNKPYGICFPDHQEDENILFAKLALKKIPFIWKSSQEKLKYQSKSIKDFMHIWFRKLKETLGKNWANLWLELMWIDVYIVKKSKQIKSISRTRSFNHRITTNKEYLREQILINFERAFEVLYDNNLEIAEVWIMFRDKSFKQEYVFIKIPAYSNNHSEILQKIIFWFEALYSWERQCRSTGVFFHKLRNYLPKQASLFDPVLRNKDQNYELTKKIQEINKSLGSHKITFWTSLLGKGEQVVQHLRT